MNHKTHYATVSEAISELRSQGFTIDLNKEGEVLLAAAKQRGDSVKIVDVYRYEGNTDPADEAVVYAIASSGGMKGILVTGYGGSDTSSEFLAKL